MDQITFSPPPLEGTLSFYVANCILGAIADGRLPAGKKLPSEHSLTDLFGVGRNAVRDAVKILSCSGILTIRRGEGTFVQDHCTPALIAPLMFELIWADLTPADLLGLYLASFHAHLLLILSPDTRKELSPSGIDDCLEEYDRFTASFTFPPTEAQMEEYWSLRGEWVFYSSKNPTFIDLCGSEFVCLTLRQWDYRKIFTEKAQWRELFRLDRRELEIVKTGDLAAADSHEEALRRFWTSALKGLDVIPTYPDIGIPGKEAASHSSYRRVYQRIAWDTLRRTYPPGGRLPTELSLSRSLNVSRNTLREVIKCMEAIGVITVARGDGMYVSPQRTCRLTTDDRIFGRILNQSDRDSLYELRTSVRQGLSYLEQFQKKPNAILIHLDAILTRILGSP